MNKKYIRFPHTADLKLQCFGENKEELFCNALIGMFQSCHPINNSCEYQNSELYCPQLPSSHSFSLEAPTLEVLLVDFLSEALYLSDVHNEAYLDAQIIFTTSTSLDATIKGIPIIGFEKGEIKAVTFNELKITKNNDSWQAIVVFDL